MREGGLSSAVLGSWGTNWVVQRAGASLMSVLGHRDLNDLAFMRQKLVTTQGGLAGVLAMG